MKKLIITIALGVMLTLVLTFSAKADRWHGRGGYYYGRPHIAYRMPCRFARPYVGFPYVGAPYIGSPYIGGPYMAPYPVRPYPRPSYYHHRYAPRRYYY